MRRIDLAIVLGVCVGLAACSSANADSDAGSPSAAVEDVASESVDEGLDASGSTDEDVADAGAPTDDAPATVDALRPARGPETTTAPEANGKTAYISRLLMTSKTIEVHWSDTEGVAEYHIHRVPRTSDDEPRVQAMTADNRIHVADEGGRFTDRGVDAGAEYWHGVREFSADGDLTAHGWHRTAAIDDEEPPSMVDGITAVAQAGEVLVTWTRPDENYQLHGYRVFRGVDGAPPESIAVTWRLDQMSFIDDEPPTSAQVVYEVVAFDFHWNDSAPSGVTIDLP